MVFIWVLVVWQTIGLRRRVTRADAGTCDGCVRPAWGWGRVVCRRWNGAAPDQSDRDLSCCHLRQQWRWRARTLSTSASSSS